MAHHLAASRQIWQENHVFGFGWKRGWRREYRDRRADRQRHWRVRPDRCARRGHGRSRWTDKKVDEAYPGASAQRPEINEARGGPVLFRNLKRSRAKNLLDVGNVSGREGATTGARLADNHGSDEGDVIGWVSRGNRFAEPPLRVSPGDRRQVLTDLVPLFPGPPGTLTRVVRVVVGVERIIVGARSRNDRAHPDEVAELYRVRRS